MVEREQKEMLSGVEVREEKHDSGDMGRKQGSGGVKS